MGTTIAGLEGVIAGESEICYIDGYQGVLSYRGYNIHTLADNGTFEEIIFLLWHGCFPKAPGLRRLRRTWWRRARYRARWWSSWAQTAARIPWMCCARRSPC